MFENKFELFNVKRQKRMLSFVLRFTFIVGEVARMCVAVTAYLMFFPPFFWFRSRYVGELGALVVVAAGSN